MREVKQLLSQMTRGYQHSESSPIKTEDGFDNSADFDRAEQFNETYDDD